MSESINVLFIEDNLGDARLIEEELRAARSKTFVQLEWVDRLDKGLETIASHPIDAILLDLSLPDSEGLDTLRRILSHAPQIPVIVMTGQADEEVATRAVQSGAQDYLIKGEVDGRLLTRSIQYSIQRKQSERALRESEERFRLVVQSAPSAMIVVDHAGKIDLTNTEAEKLFGYRANELLGQPIELLVPEPSREAHTNFQHHYLSQPQAMAIGMRRNLYGLQKDGREIPLEIGLTPYQTSEGLRVLAMINDITERKLAEEALREKERLLTEAQRIGHMGSWTYNIVEDFIQFSDEMYRLFDVIPTEFKNNSEGLLALIYAGDRQIVESWIHEVKAGKPIRELEFRLLHRRGELHYMQARGRIEFNPLGQPIQFTGTIQDVTEQKIADLKILEKVNHLNALRTIDQAIISSSDLHLTLNIVLAQVLEQLQVDATDVLLLNDDELTFEYAYGKGFRTNRIKNMRVPFGESYAGRVAKQRSSLEIKNLGDQYKDPMLIRLLEEESFQFYCGVPLISKGAVQGVLEVYHRVPFEPYSEWRDFLDALAKQTAVVIDKANLLRDLQQSNLELIRAYDSTIEGWSRALDLRDKETEGHTQRVTGMTLHLASAMGISEAELTHIRRGCLLHDIGKMGIPDRILLKPQPLTEEEWQIMRMHPQYAYEMLSPIQFLKQTLDIPYCHHEKWDGSGYPRGLKGEDIPFVARVFAVVDVWDALRSSRAYRPAWSEEDAAAYIREQSSKHFDPSVVEIFLKQLE